MREGEAAGAGSVRGCLVLPEIAVVEEESTVQSGSLNWKWKEVIIRDSLFVEVNGRLQAYRVFTQLKK